MLDQYVIQNHYWNTGCQNVGCVEDRDYVDETLELLFHERDAALAAIETWRIQNNSLQASLTKAREALGDIWVCDCGNCCSGRYCDEGAASREAKSRMYTALGMKY